MYKLIILLTLIISISFIGCSNKKYNYWEDNNCRYKIERHYNEKGKYTGSTWTTVCD